MTEQQAVTATLSEHARQRAAAMGVCTKRIKRIVRNPDILRVSYRGRWVATSDADPELAVVYTVDPGGQPVVVTVLYRNYQWYDRCTGQVMTNDADEATMRESA